MVQLEQQHDACKDDLNNALASKIASREALKSSMAEKERNLRKSESEAEELFKVFYADMFVDCPFSMLMSQSHNPVSNFQTIQLCFVCVCALQQFADNSYVLCMCVCSAAMGIEVSNGD
jgi:hypothetical protein